MDKRTRLLTIVIAIVAIGMLGWFIGLYISRIGLNKVSV